MAAGLNIDKDKLELFQKAFDEEVTLRASAEMLNKYMITDGPLEPHEISLANAEILRDGGPWGQGFPEPVFHGVFEVVEQRLVGVYHLKMVLAQQNQWFDAIAFNVDLTQWPNYRCRRVNAVYQLDVNIYQQRKRLQLLVNHLEAIS
jgi:single-stranded-DNA-specific exonuclease